jgi:hypothetical protein
VRAGKLVGAFVSLSGESRVASGRAKHQAHYLCFTTDEPHTPRPHFDPKTPSNSVSSNTPILSTNTSPIPRAHDRQIQANMNDEQERQLERSISRAIAFLTKIFFMVAGVIDRRVLLSESKVAGERLLRFCFQEDLSNELLERESAFASEESVRAMKSHNHCVFVCKLLAGLLAWLTGGKSHSDLLQQILTTNETHQSSNFLSAPGK